MPLQPGKKNIGPNISELEQHGHKHDQAVAIALHEAGVPRSTKAAALHLDTLNTKHKQRVSAMKQVYVRKRMDHCNASRLVLGEVLSQERDTLRVKLQGSQGIVEVSAAEVVPVSSVRPGSITRNPKQPRALPAKSFPRSATALGNLL